MLPPVIGIVGATGAGKSTVSKMLVQDVGYLKMSMAGPLKDMLRALGLSEMDVNGPQEHRLQPCMMLSGRTPRFAAQTLGTEWGRETISPDIWVNAVQQRIINHQAVQQINTQKGRITSHRGVVLDDIRFPNEWEMIRRLGGVLIRVRRPGVEVKRTWLDKLYHRKPKLRFLLLPLQLFGWRPIHESEFHWPDVPVDVEFWNHLTEADLATSVTSYLERLQAPEPE